VKPAHAWAAFGTIVLLFMTTRCGGPDPSEEAVPGPTVTVTATATATPVPIVRVRATVPAPCREAAADSEDVEAATFVYEQYTGAIAEVNDLAATGIASQDIDKINASREKLSDYQIQSTAALQDLLRALDHLKAHNKQCREALSR